MKRAAPPQGRGKDYSSENHDDSPIDGSAAVKHLIVETASRTSLRAFTFERKPLR